MVRRLGTRLIGTKEFLKILDEGNRDHNGGTRQSDQEERCEDMHQERAKSLHVRSMPSKLFPKAKESIRNS